MHYEIEEKDGIKIYKPTGPLFFASIHNFREHFDPNNDPQEVIIDFARSRVSDHSGIEAIDSLAERYLKLGKILHLRHLTPECLLLLHKAKDLIEVNVIEDPKYAIADDALDS
jgi:SulP family sulfate permease